MKLISGNISYLPQYTDLLQKTYESAYVDDSLGLTKDCFSREIFYNQATQSYLRSRLELTDHLQTWLAFDQDKLIGSITVILLSDTEAELTGFYVDPAFQGQGIGKKLYQLALGFAGKRALVLDIYLHNQKTIELYKKWGWQLDTSRGDNGYFYRHWPEWPAGLQAKAMYMRLVKKTR